MRPRRIRSGTSTEGRAHVGRGRAGAADPRSDCRVSAEWMAAYEAADAAAEKAFRELVYEEGASRGDSSEPGGKHG